MRVANGAPDLLRVVASADVGDAVAPALLQAFDRRAPNVEATLGIAGTREMARPAVRATRRRGPRPGARRSARAGCRQRAAAALSAAAGRRHRPSAAVERRCVAAGAAQRAVARRSVGHRSAVRRRAAARRSRRRRGPRARVPDAGGGVGGGGDRRRRRPGDRAAVEARPARRCPPAEGRRHAARHAVAHQHAARRSALRRPPAGCIASWRRPTPPRRCSGPTAACRPRSSARPST